MKILYVTTTWPGFRECLFEGREEPSGLPSFNKPLVSLIKQGNDVDFVLLHKYEKFPEYNIKVDWLSEKQIKGTVFYNLTGVLRFKGISELRKTVDKVLSEKEYDFVYAHGTTTSVVREIAKKHNVAFGERIYGTFLWDCISKHGKFYASIRHHIEYRAFKTKKAFVIATNDGSRADLVCEALNKKEPKYEFKYWINGVNRVTDITEEELTEYKKTLVNKPFLFYVARFDRWKRQDRAVRILDILRKKGHDIHLYLAGPAKTVGYTFYNEVLELIKELNLEENVTIMGNIDSKTINYMCKLAVASVSMYDVCNLTNVFHEMLAAGSVTVVKKDGVVNDFVEDGKNGFLVETVEEAAEKIDIVLNNTDTAESIRRNAIITSAKKMKTWDDRIQDEIDLIKKYAGKGWK